MADTTLPQTIQPAPEEVEVPCVGDGGVGTVVTVPPIAREPGQSVRVSAPYRRGDRWFVKVWREAAKPQQDNPSGQATRRLLLFQLQPGADQRPHQR